MRESGASSGKGFPGLGSISSSGGLGGFLSEDQGDGGLGMEGGMDDGYNQPALERDIMSSSRVDNKKSMMSSAPKKGMVLGKSGSTNKFLEAMKAEGELVDASVKGPGTGLRSSNQLESKPSSVVPAKILTVVLTVLNTQTK